LLLAELETPKIKKAAAHDATIPRTEHNMTAPASGVNARFIIEA
jgi:hypothetical protein